MTRIQELESLVSLFNLHQHPYYQDWQAGTLPLSKLIDYSGEYGQFVSTVAAGWETVGERERAHQERSHEILWDDFREAVGFQSLTLRPQTDTMISAARNLFSLKPEALGALFASESQQGLIAQRKLHGLQHHYRLPEKGLAYFKARANLVAELDTLKKHIRDLSGDEFQRTKTACAILSAAMWGALDGVYYV